MRLLIQRVRQASVTIDYKIYSQIDAGLLVFVGIHKDDETHQSSWLANKCLNLRIFSDDFGKMNLNVKDVEGQVLIVSQFTLYGTCESGNRPEFTKSAKGVSAEYLYDHFVKEVKSLYSQVETGIFAANMKVELINDGPVTLIIDR